MLWGKWFALKWKTTIFRFYNSPSSTCDDKFLSSVLFWFQQLRSIYFRVYMYREISSSEKKIHSSFLRKCVSWLFKIPRILTHITAFHSLVKRSDFYLPFLLLFVFFWMCGNDQNSFKKKVFIPNLGRGARIFLSKWTRHASEEFPVELVHESYSNTVRLGIFLSFPIYSNLRAERYRKVFAPGEKVFDWFLVLEPVVSYLAYHEHDCTFSYIHM